MGQLVKIILKDRSEESIIKTNEILKEYGIINSFTTEQDNIDWVQDINTNPLSPQKHLKPITLEGIKEAFGLWTDVGLMSFDVAFSRTSQLEAEAYTAFIHDHMEIIDTIDSGKELIERYDLIDEVVAVIKKLSTKEKEPEKLPEDQRTKHDLQGGLFLCKSWSISPFWIIFGKVDSPVFLKDRIYVDDNYNSLYKDKNGYAYMLFPLLTVDKNQLDAVIRIYDQAWELGLRENYNFIIPLIYGMDIVNITDVAKNYSESYSIEELRERFFSVMKTTSSIYPYNGCYGFVWNDIKKRFIPTGTNTPMMQLQTKCSVLTSLVRSLPAEMAAEIMSTLLNKKYIASEFKI